MANTDLTRRDFHQLAMAAFGGVVAGTFAGCPSTGSDPAPVSNGATGDAAAAPATDIAYMLEEPHVCRGLNTCENKGKAGMNACAGQGTCASVVAHNCSGQNACKGQGGCGQFPGANGCKGLGHCGVPLTMAWDTARKNFEKAMQDAGKTVGAAPAA